MKMMETAPHPNDPTLRERFNLMEFVAGSIEERHRFMLAIARDRYASECEMHIHKVFGLPQERMEAWLRGKTVMELGCFVGGSVVAHAEAYGVQQMYGVDIDEQFLEAARLFAADRPGHYEFLKGSAEAIPLTSESCDAILTQDTIEHVNDVELALRECFRVLKPSGLLLCVFPSFYHPWGNHLGMVTNFPWLHLLFSDEVLEAAYRSIMDERGEEAYWYRPENPKAMHRQRFHGVNGITAARFRTLAQRLNFAVVYKKTTPIFSVGRKVQRHPWLKVFALPLWPLAMLPAFEELLLHRICYVLQKAPVPGAPDILRQRETDS
jgi:ubiquinone/menaquinone biosynthesis C-methylase UbiE